jgi:DNA-directed RNA polymerase subunit RPC12/RpoP
MSKEPEKVVRCPMCGKGEIGDEYDYEAEEFIYFCWDCGNQWTEERV